MRSQHAERQQRIPSAAPRDTGRTRSRSRSYKHCSPSQSFGARNFAGLPLVSVEYVWAKRANNIHGSRYLVALPCLGVSLRKACRAFEQSCIYIAGASRAPWLNRHRNGASMMIARSSGAAGISRLATGVAQVTPDSSDRKHALPARQQHHDLERPRFDRMNRGL